MDEEQKRKAREARRSESAGNAGGSGRATVSDLDQRIVDKLGKGTSQAPQQLNQLERDIEAKQQAHGAMPSASTPGASAVRPGAYSSGGSGSQQLSDLERDIQGKQRVGATAAEGRTSLASLESDIQAKNRVGATRGGGGNTQSHLSALESEIHAKQRVGATASGGGRAHLSSLESDIQAKQRVGATASGGITAASQLLSLESDIHAKQRAVAAGGSASAQLSSLENEISAKQRAGAMSSGRAQLSSLENDIQAKQRVGATAGGSAGAQLSSLENDIQAKNRVGASASAPQGLRSLEDSISTKTSSQQGVGSSAVQNLSSLENSISAKMVSSSGPRARTGLDSLEDSLAAKNVVGAGGTRSNLQSFENAIASKTRHGEQRARGELDGLENAVLSKQMGIPIGAVSGGGAPMELRDLEESLNAKSPGTIIDDTSERVGFGHKGLVSDIDDFNKKDVNITEKFDEHGIEEDDQDLHFGIMEEGEHGLAVAVAVEDDEEEAYIPAAIEYDPDAKPPMFRERRYRLYAFICFFVLLAGSVGAAIGIVVSRGEEPTIPTPAPTFPRQNIGIEETILRIVDAEELRDVSSPYYRALEWITFDDPEQFTPESRNFLQRYLLVYFYFATTVDGEWEGGCNPPKEGETNICTFNELVLEPADFFPARGTRWLSSTNECIWYGVECDDDGQVIGIELPGGGFSGTFPVGITKLPFLGKLSLTYGTMTGSIPAELFSLKYLTNLDVDLNAITDLPAEVWDAPSLQWLDLQGNQIEGEIPPGISKNKDMKHLWLNDNIFRGEFPDEFFELTSLLSLYVGGNNFDGTLSSNFGKFTQLERIRLDRNGFVGTLPDVWSGFQYVRTFEVQANSLSGPIPSSLWSINPFVVLVDLNSNNFNGTVSEDVAKLSSISQLDLSANLLSGPIPSHLGDMTTLNLLRLQNNLFTGPMPQAVCDLRLPFMQNSNVDGLTDLEADCLDGDLEDAEVECSSSCCTKCCDVRGNCEAFEF